MDSPSGPSKKSRRFHHKSKYGCAACKQRKIKCDENKPVCANCAQRGLDCSLKDTTPVASRQLTTTAASESSNLPLLGWLPTQIALGLGPSFCRSGTRDLELYCHFQAHTAQDFAPRWTSVFRDEIPRLAISFPFVGHGLLATSYLHLARLSQNPPELRREAALHVNQALPDYLARINTITEENATGLYAFALFVVLFSQADISEDTGILLQTARNVPSKRTEALRKAVQNPVKVIHAHRNILGIFCRSYQWIAAGPLSPLIQRFNSPALSEPWTSWMRVEDGRLAMLSRLWMENPAIRFSQANTLSEALNSLRDTFAMVTQLTALPLNTAQNNSHPGVDLGEIHRQLSAGRLDDIPSVFTWYVRVSPEFIDMLGQGNVYAMVILAHFAIVLERACPDKWWNQRLPHYFVDMADLVLGEERRAWIEWPLLVVKQARRALFLPSQAGPAS